MDNLPAEILPAETKNTPEKFLTSKELRMRDAGLTRESAYKKVLEMQKEIVKDLTYNIVNCSDYEAGEILADKILKNKLV